MQCTHQTVMLFKHKHYDSYLMKKLNLIVICTCVMLVGASLFLQHAHAREKNNWRYSRSRENIFKVAAYVYYNNRAELNQPGLTCKPQNVKIVYGEYGWGELAHAYWNAGYKDSYDNDALYCTVFINTQTGKEIPANACLTFIHEYGHLIGKDHNSNIKSVMYDGYDKYSGVVRKRLFDRNNKLVLGRSLCNVDKIRQGMKG